MADIITILLGFFRIIFGFLLVLFIPGCAISFVFYPRIADIPTITRIVLSCVISIGSTLCTILFLDIFLGINTTAVNCSIAILSLSALACIFWGVRQAFYSLRGRGTKRIYFPKIL
jgi:uncharacterized membrane protein